MKFTVKKADLNFFKNEVSSICKKFKVNSFDFKISEEYKIGEYKTVSKTYPIIGYDVVVIVPEIEKIEETGYTYLGCIKNEDNILSVHSTPYASENGVELSHLKDEIENFPCEECGKKIFRKIIHVFEKDSNIKVYGSGCAVKKFGLNLENTLDKFLWSMDRIKEIVESEEEGGYSGFGFGIDIEEWITLCFCSIYRTGYTSGSYAYNNGGISTAEATLDDYDFLNNRYMKESDKSIFKKKIKEDIEKTNFDFTEFVAWLPSFKEKFNEDNDFHFNMKATIDALMNMSMPLKMKGYVAYTVFSYWKDKHTVKEEKASYNEDYSKLNVGDKLKDIGPIKVEIVGCHSFSTEFGMKYIYTMKDIDNGYKWKWFASVAIDTSVDHEIYSGTIKSFEDHAKFGKSIVLTRCKTKEI